MVFARAPQLILHCLQAYLLWQMKMYGDSVFIFDDVNKNQSLTCEIQTDCVSSFMTSLPIVRFDFSRNIVGANFNFIT